MSDEAIDLRPLKTWSHLARERRRPSEYEIVSTNLHWHTRSDQPWDVAPNGFMTEWYVKYRNQSAIQRPDWDAFRDPDQVVYRSYNILQDGQETYVDGLLDQFSEEEHDLGLSAEWINSLARLYTPGRYLLHCVQMGSAYLQHMAPASTISNCAAFQAADQLRWVSRIAYRTRELAIAHPGVGFGEHEREHWEGVEAWQGFRELLERALVTRDWAESFLALNVIAKPAIDEAFFRAFEESARRNADVLFALLAEAALRDSDRSRSWTAALIEMMLGGEHNVSVINEWMSKWLPLGEQAIRSFCKGLPDHPDAGDEAVALSAQVPPGAQRLMPASHDRTVQWEIAVEHGDRFLAASDDTVLRAGLRAGLGFPYECNTGACGTCKYELIDGEVIDLRPEAPALSDRDRRRGRHLGCQSLPRCDLRIRVRLAPGFEPLHRPRHNLAELVRREMVTHDMASLVFATGEPAVFRPGQYCLVDVAGVVGSRAYSMANVPNEAGEWELHVKSVPGGAASTALLKQVEVGDTVGLDGPYGMAYAWVDNDRDVVCVAGGSGLGAMLGIARGLADVPGAERKRLWFLYGGRTPEDIYGRTFWPHSGSASATFGTTPRSATTAGAPRQPGLVRCASCTSSSLVWWAAMSATSSSTRLARRP